MSSSTDARTRTEAAPHAGLRLLIDIWRREWWNLLLLNLMFIAAALPVVTIGPALAALNRVTLRMVQDKPIDLWHEFRTAFFENFGQGMLAGLTLALAGLATGWPALFFLLNLGHGLLMLLLLAAALFAMLFAALAGFYVLAQIAVVRLPFPDILNNAIRLACSDPKRTLPALFASAGLAALPFLYPPAAPLVFMILFPATSLFANLAVWPGIRTHVLKRAG